MKRAVFVSLLTLLACVQVLGQTCPFSAFSREYNFRLIDDATGLPITDQVLCRGRKVRIEDISSPKHDPSLLFYSWGTAAGTCRFDQPEVFTPTQTGPLVFAVNVNANRTPGAGSGIIVASAAYAVRDSSPPEFTLTPCGDQNTVEVLVKKQAYDSYTIEIGGAPIPIQPDVLTSLPASGGTPVTVTGRYTGQSQPCANATTLVVPSLPAPATRIPLQRLVVQGTSAEFRFGPLQPEYRYSLQLQDAAAPGGYRTVAQVPATGSSFTLPNASVPGCYRLLLSDACQTAGFTRSSPPICSVQLTATASNGRNQLSWRTDATGNLALLRDGQLLQNLPAGSTQFEDADVVCGTTYRYRLVVSNPLVASESNEASVTTVSSVQPPTPQLLASFNLRNQVELTATTSGAGGQLTFVRNGTALGTTPARLLRDSLLTPRLAEALCYTVRLQDACGNRSSDSAPVCPVVLEATAANQTGTEIRLTWSALRGPTAAAPVTYEVLTLSETNAVLTRRPVQGLTYLDTQPPQNQQQVRYRIEASGAGLAAPSFSNVAEVGRDVKLFVPTAFTPNGDGLNDVLELKGRFLDRFRFVVIDRNGKEVFQTTDRTRSWDGRINGQQPVPGAYVWRFEATDQNGQRSVQHGTVTVIR